MTTPSHGTERRYRLNCHCDACKEAARKARARRALLAATGRWQPYTDPTPARQHVHALLDAGFTRQEIARTAGASQPTIDRLIHGRTTEIRTQIAHAILAIDPQRTRPDRFLTDATGTRRRLQALYWRGYSTEAILRATALGSDRNIRLITRGEIAQVTRPTRDAVDGAYRHLADLDPAEYGVPHDAAQRARAFARRRGFAPAAAWDEDTIDDPAAVPDLGAKVKRQDAIAEDAEWIARTTGAGPDQIAARLGVSRNYLDKVRERAVARGRELIGSAA